MKLLIVGATGLVSRLVLQLALVLIYQSKNHSFRHSLALCINNAFTIFFIKFTFLWGV